MRTSDSLLGRISDFLARPEVTTTMIAVAAGATIMVVPDTAYALIPIPAVDQMVQDVSDETSARGGVIGTIGGLGLGAWRMITSHAQDGMGTFLKAGAGGGMFGAAAPLSGYFMAGG